MKQRHSHIFERHSRDHYVEPAWTSERLFSVENFEGPILDPCCGWGTILTTAHNAGYEVIGSDIVDRRPPEFSFEFHQQNIFDLSARRHAGSVVCNPPFDQIFDVTYRCIELARRKVALVCPVRRLNAARWLQDLPLRRIWLLTPRPSMPSGDYIKNGGKVHGGTIDFAWLIFEKGYTGTPELKWLHKDK
jgi:hypothetical protein